MLVAALALVGCGGEGPVSADAAAKLHADVAAVRAANARGDAAAALKALAPLQAQVKAPQALPGGDERTLTTGIARLRRRLQAGTTTPAATPSSTPTPSTPTPSPT